MKVETAYKKYLKECDKYGTHPLCLKGFKLTYVPEMLKKC